MVTLTRLPGLILNVLLTLFFVLFLQTEMTEGDLLKLLQDNELTDFDPIKEAFKIYAPDDEEFLSKKVLKKVLGSMGFKDISDDDLQVK